MTDIVVLADLSQHISYQSNWIHGFVTIYMNVQLLNRFTADNDLFNLI